MSDRIRCSNRELFSDKDESTGRPKLQQSWINYALWVMERDKTGRIWHPQLREKIMRDLEKAVTISNLTPSQSPHYNKIAEFARGKRRSYRDLDLWVALFRIKNGPSRALSHGENSEIILAFADVINAIVNCESEATVMRKYARTRDDEKIRYFEITGVEMLAKPADINTSQAHGINSGTSKKCHSEGRIVVELISSDNEITLTQGQK